MGETLERPTAVSVGVVVIGLPFVAGFVQLALNVIGMGNLQEPVSMVPALAGAATLSLQLYIVWLAAQGRNWARIAAAAISVMGLMTALDNVEVVSDSDHHPLLLLVTATMTLAPLGLVPLFMPTSNAWYRRIKVNRAAA